MSLKPIGPHGCGSTPHDIFILGDYAVRDWLTIEYYPPLIRSVLRHFFVISRTRLLGSDFVLNPLLKNLDRLVLEKVWLSFLMDFRDRVLPFLHRIGPGGEG